MLQQVLGIPWRIIVPSTANKCNKNDAKWAESDFVPTPTLFDNIAVNFGGRGESCGDLTFCDLGGHDHGRLSFPPL